MQRNEDDGIVICCDFCGTDWDQKSPMIEGHHGSVICLECFKVAYENSTVQQGEYFCALCIRESLPESLPRWTPPSRDPKANPQAVVCHECLQQAARTFNRDEDVAWSM